ncbi:hypothetical protein TA3x_004422 [Tundrisphaera sp. TA3]|uniref:hypothetical protein n=1 Tax=Tundrisphaera sp. TA3 TaxID=3435775 RepID=UPI003EB79C33
MSRLAAIFLGVILIGPGPSPAAETVPPHELRPYTIRARVDFEVGTRIDGARKSEFIAAWLNLVHRFVGTAWSIEVVDGTEPVPGRSVEDASADAMKQLAGAADKAWFIEVRPEGRGFLLIGREYDAATGWLGQVHRRSVLFPADAPRGLLDVSLAIFAPLAEVGQQGGGGVDFLVRGGGLAPASPIGAVAAAGTVFRVLRIFPREGGPPEVREVPYSYFPVESMDGARARCGIIRGVSDPLSNRYARKNTLIALGIKPALEPTRLRFVARSDKRPASGYVLTVREAGESRSREVGTTDRDGRIVLEPGFASGLAILRLMAGSSEPMVEFPIMPGEAGEERVIPVETRPATLALEARLDALRDAIIDVVASRSRLELRMKARADGEDWDGLAETIREFRKLTPRDRFEARLEQIRVEGARQEAELKSLVLTKNARAQLDDTAALIARYLDDDTMRAYDEMLQQARAEAAKEKAKPQPAATPPMP